MSDFYDERTDVQYKNLNPRWDADFVIEVTHDGDIMKHPLEIKYVCVFFCGIKCSFW